MALLKPLGVVSQINDTVQTQTVKPSLNLNNAHKAKEVAAEFESLFMDLVLKSMRNTIHGSESNHALETYQSLLDSEYSKIMGNHQGIGIQEMILDWMKDNGDSKEFNGFSLKENLGTKR